VPATIVAALAREARRTHNLRHAPLLLLDVLAKTGSGSRLVSDTIAEVIQRADELTEFMALYNGGRKLSAQVKKGLRRAFLNFDSYQLAKYDRQKLWELRDVAFLSHVVSPDVEKGRMHAQLVNRTHYPDRTKSAGFPVKEAYGLDDYESLPSPDTWEVALSGGADKRETFERLLSERKLGYMALLRNLRNMVDAKVDSKLVKEAILARRGAGRVLPFRYIAAARAAPKYAKELNQALLEALPENLSGTTAVLVDVSGSMDYSLSSKSDLTRMDAAAALAALIRSDKVRIFTFSHGFVEVDTSEPGLPLIEAIKNSQEHAGTLLGGALMEMRKVPKDRLVVITDEQAHDNALVDPDCESAYMINVGSYRNGVGYGRWTHLDGFSESVLKWVVAYEAGW
jgi:hypothetical protein